MVRWEDVRSLALLRPLDPEARDILYSRRSAPEEGNQNSGKRNVAPVLDFVLQNEFWLHGGIPDVDNSSVKFSVLDDVDSVDAVRALFPNPLLVGEVHGEDMPVFMEYVHKLLKLLTTLGRLDIVMFKKSTKVDNSEFLMTAMKLKDKVPFVPLRVGQCDRLVSFVSKA